MKLFKHSAFVLALMFLSAPFTAPSAHAGQADLYSVPGEVKDKSDFRSEIRKLAEDHVTWSRLFLIGATTNAPDKDAAEKRLLQNQVDIGNALKPYYGVQAGERFTQLLTEHVQIGVELIAAATAQRTEEVSRLTARWEANADDISLFLSQANPKNWPLADLKEMMRSHLKLTAAELTARLQQDWEGDVAAYEKVHVAILQMADMLANGIIKQFPRLFR